MNEQQRLDYLNAMGIQVWLPPIQTNETVTVVKMQQVESKADVDKNPQPAHLEVDRSDKIVPWKDLCSQVKVCTDCTLHKTRTQTVFGVGNEQAEWMIIGEAPGADEDRQGEPFVGRAGLLLNEIIFSLGLQRESVFIANILKCRPPNNRDPQTSEVEACSKYLQQQLRHVAPRIILALGRIAAQNLLQTTESIGHLRGRVHYYQNIPVIVIYHPAYLLRSPIEKRKVLQDLILAQQTLKQFQSN